MNKSSVVVVLAALMGVAFIAYSVSSAFADSGGVASSGANERSSAPRPEAHAPDPEHSERIAVDGPALRFVDTRNLQPLATVRMWSAGSIKATILEFDEALESEADGRVSVASLQTAEQWVIRAEGYCPAIISKPAGSAVCQMEPGGVLEIELLDEDANPVDGAHAWLFPSGVRRSHSTESWPGIGFGDPRSECPIWTATSNARGLVEFRDMPRGSYRLVVRHPQFLPASPTGLGDTDVEVPGRLDLSMQEFYGVVCEAPPGRKIISYSWALPQNLDRNPSIIRARARALEALRERFPSAIAFVGRPKTGPGRGDAVIGVQAMMDGNSLSYMEWPLRRISQIEAPVYLEPTDEVPFRSVACTFLNAAGQPLSLRLRWQPEAVAGKRMPPVFTEAGEPCLLPPGRYRVWPNAVPSWVVDAIEDNELVISDTDPLELSKIVRLKTSLRSVVVRPRVPGGEMKGVLHLMIQADEAHYGVTNWSPVEGDVECLLPIGAATISVQAPFYTLLPRQFDVVEGEGPLAIELDLQEGTPSEGGAGPALVPNGR